MKKIRNEAMRRLGKWPFGLIDAEDKELIAKVVSKTIASMIIFTLLLLSSAGMSWLADVLEAAAPSMQLEALLIRIASTVLLAIDLIWLINLAIRPFRSSKG